MNRIFNFVKVSSVIILLILGVITTLLIMFCNTTALKPVIVSQVMKYTEQKITIDGDMHWSFFPSLAINISHVKVDDVQHRNLNIDLSDVRVGVKLLPMLLNKLEAANLEATIDVFSPKSFVNTHMVLNTDLGMNFYNNNLSFHNLNLAVKTQAGRRIVRMQITGDLLADIKHETLHWNDIDCQSEYFTMIGQMDMDHIFHAPVVQGNVNVEIGDLKELLQALGQKMNGLQEINGVNGDLIFNYANNALNANGDFRIENFQALNLTAMDVNTHVFLHNSSINFTQITSKKTYGGSFEGQGSINLSTDTPHLSLQGKFTNVDTALLWADVIGSDHKIHLSGVGTIEFQINTNGTSSRQLLKNLNGKSSVNFENGYLTGVDLAYWINHAYVSVHKQPVVADRVPFVHLAGSIKINHGVLSNDDLLLEMPEIKAKGKGKIDLGEQSVEYVLHTSAKNVILEQIGNIHFTLQDFVPIHIKGNLANPEVYVEKNND